MYTFGFQSAVLPKLLLSNLTEGEEECTIFSNILVSYALLLVHFCKLKTMKPRARFVKEQKKETVVVVIETFL